MPHLPIRYKTPPKFSPEIEKEMDAQMGMIEQDVLNPQLPTAPPIEDKPDVSNAGPRRRQLPTSLMPKLSMYRHTANPAATHRDLTS